MKAVENEILSLAEDIYVGKCNVQAASIRMENIEKKYGSIDTDIAYPKYIDNPSQEYLDELIERVRVGLYSRALIIDLAKAANAVYGTSGKKTNAKKPVIIGVAIVALILLAVIIAKDLGE